MNTKRITYLSDLYKAIGNYLFEHGDADIRAIATHNNGLHTNHLKYSLMVHDFTEPDDNKENIITVDYHNVSINDLNLLIHTKENK